MKNRFALMTIVAAAGLACPALAQDSTSRNSDAGNGLPGDALSPWTVGAPFQKSAYVVDMQTFFTSGSTVLGIAPIIKTSKASSTFFDSQISAHAISQTLRNNVGYAANSYTAWTVPTAGVNPAENKQGAGFTSTVNVSGNSTRFGAVLADFATSDGGFSTNNIIGALVNYDPANPGRLFVQRTVAAVNEPNGLTGDSSQFGIGSVDADGNIHLRADGFNTVGPAPFTGVNYFRVNTALRNTGAINFFDNAGGSDAAATKWLLVNTAAASNTPSGIPADLAGRPVLLGSDFNKSFIHEKVANVLTIEPPVAHLAAPATDQRGGVGFSKKVLRGGVGTAGLLGKTASDTDAISIWGVDANGNYLNSVTLVRPAVLTDPCDSFNFSGVFDGYRSQVAARGGNGIVAIGQDRQGRGLAAAVVYSSAFAQQPWNGIAVVRFDPANPTATAQWTLAAWNDTGNFTGKPLRGDYGVDGYPFTGDAGEFNGRLNSEDAPIGRLASALEVSNSLVGPSMSTPAFDSAGNIYFISAIVQNKLDINNVPFKDFDIALVRGIYNEATFCYDLEVVLEPGDTFVGKNSNTKYQIRFFDLLDSNSVSSGTIFSGNVNQASWNNVTVDPRAKNSAPENLGGLVVGAKIVYDVNADGLYEDPTSATGNPASVDEAYNVLLYIGNPSTPYTCPADFNNDGFLTGDDFDNYVAFFELGDINSDYNNDGFVNGDDFDAFVADFEVGC